MSDEAELILTFDTEHPEFCRGFEAGLMWGRIEFGDEDPIPALVTPKNAEMIMRMAEASNCEFTGEWVNEDWMTVQLKRKKNPDG